MTKEVQELSDRFCKETKPQVFVAGMQNITAHTLADAQMIVMIRDHMETGVKLLVGMSILMASCVFGQLSIVIGGYPLVVTNFFTENLSVEIESAGNATFTAPAEGSDNKFYRLKATPIPEPAPEPQPEHIGLPAPSWMFSIRNDVADETTITWEPVPFAPVYLLFISNDPSPKTMTFLASTGRTEYVDPRIVTGIYYAVTAYDYQGQGSGWPTNALAWTQTPEK